jgi:hypothetical protein
MRRGTATAPQTRQVRTTCTAQPCKGPAPGTESSSSSSCQVKSVESDINTREWADRPRRQLAPPQPACRLPQHPLRSPPLPSSPSASAAHAIHPSDISPQAASATVAKAGSPLAAHRAAAVPLDATLQPRADDCAPSQTQRRARGVAARRRFEPRRQLAIRNRCSMQKHDGRGLSG